MKFLYAQPFVAVGANDIDAFIPEFWANESLAILEENMVVANLIHRDFEPIIANFGDVVNTRRPGEFAAKRKTNDDSVTVQDATATNVQVPLDQHVHVSFLIKDGEESKSMSSLVLEYMAPAMLAQARFIDQVILGQAYRFLGNVYGGLGKLTSNNTVDYLTGVRNKMNINKAYVSGRNLILTPNTETTFLNTGLFIQANTSGDGGTALAEASLGRKFGFDMYMCQNASSITTGNTLLSGVINNAAGYAKGTTVVTVDSFTGAVTTGAWITIDGDDQPLRITAHSETLGTTTSITFTPALKADVADNAVVRQYTPGAVNNAAGYTKGYSKEITVDGFTVAPQVGQLVAFGTASDVYTIINVNALVGITLDRPLAADIADNALVSIGPRGEFNLAFHRNALALVVRPLAMPRQGTGALSAVVNLNGLSVRATITYDGNKQGHLVTLDMLCGIAILDTKLGAVLLG